MSRTSARKIARKFARQLRDEQPDYAYLKAIFRHLRQELGVEVPRPKKSLPYVPDRETVQHLYQVFAASGRTQDLVIFKTLLYTGVRCGELVAIRLDDVDLEAMQIRIVEGKGDKDRRVPFPAAFREVLAVHVERMRDGGATHLFESNRHKPYSERGIRRMFARYSEVAGLEPSVSPHKLRHFLLLWLKKQGLDDALIQPYSGHASRQSLEIYSTLALREAQASYDEVMKDFPV